MLIIALGVGLYVYASSQSGNNNVSTATTRRVIDATISTSKGIIQVELYPDSAPKTVANFVSLANSGFYDNLVWHRIANGFVIQTGDPKTRGAVNSTRDTWGTGGSNQIVPLEIDSSLHNYAGYLGMARGDDANSATSQFYINLVDNSRKLDPNPSAGLSGYTVFGRVISGMEVVNAIASVQTLNVPQTSPLYNQPVDATSVMVTSISISNKP